MAFTLLLVSVAITLYLIGIVGEILLLTDVTETRRLQEVVERNSRLSSMGEMTARLAHQIRTPLASALLYVSQIEQAEEQTALVRRFAGRAIGKLRELEQMINDMVVFAGGGRSEDLFVYTVEHVTLKKGQRMVLPVSEFELGYRDVYTLDIPFAAPPVGDLRWRPPQPAAEHQVDRLGRVLRERDPDRIARADEPDAAMTAEQLARFEQAVSGIDAPRCQATMSSTISASAGRRPGSTSTATGTRWRPAPSSPSTRRTERGSCARASSAC